MGITNRNVMQPSVSWLIVTLLLSISFSFSGCKSDGDDEEGNKPQNTLSLDVSGGNLSSLITTEQKYDVQKLILTGNLNGDDIRFLREMTGRDRYGNPTGGKLEYLDIKNAHIVKGGDYYYLCYGTSDDRIGEYMFFKCLSMKTLILPFGIKQIDDDAFVNAGLTAMTIPDSVRNIGTAAFSECDSLRSVTMTDNVTSLNEFAFEGCVSLTDVRLSDSIKTLEGTFMGCHSIQSVSLPKALTKLGHRLFYDCTHLLSVDIPANVEVVDENIPFAFCPHLKAIHVDAANKNCTSVDGVLLSKDKKTLVSFPPGYSSDSYTIPPSVMYVAHYAFLGSDSLRQITIPASVRDIAYGAFLSCSSLTDIYLQGSCPFIGGISDQFASFEQSTCKNCTVHVPYEYLGTYQSDKSWSMFAHIVSY